MSVENIVAFNWIQELKTKAEKWIGRTFTSGWENLGDQIELLLSFFENGGQLTDKDIPVKKITINNTFQYSTTSGESGYRYKISSTRVFKYQNTFGIYNVEDGYRVFPNWNIFQPEIESIGSGQFSLGGRQYINFQNYTEPEFMLPNQREHDYRLYIAVNGRFALYYDQSANTFNIMKDDEFYKSIFLMPSDVVLGTICDMDGTPLWSNGNLLYSENNIWYLPQPLKAMTYTGHLYLFPLYGREIWECSL